MPPDRQVAVQNGGRQRGGLAKEAGPQGRIAMLQLRGQERAPPGHPVSAPVPDPGIASLESVSTGAKPPGKHPARLRLHACANAEAR
ncbi:MAG: hypothetical protein DI605_12780 [Sphingomonas sp.]|nr:MAG: hypothetical protein DI605_12780 [Sphingomonas sp.]